MEVTKKMIANITKCMLTEGGRFTHDKQTHPQNTRYEKTSFRGQDINTYT